MRLPCSRLLSTLDPDHAGRYAYLVVSSPTERRACDIVQLSDDVLWSWGAIP